MVEVYTFDKNDECLNMILVQSAVVSYQDKNIRVYYPNGDFQNISYKEMISHFMASGSNVMVIKVRV